MRNITLFLLGCAVAVAFLPTAKAQDDDDTLFTLVLLQMVTQKNDPNAMRSLYPLLLSSILGDKDKVSDDNSLYYLLLGVGNDAALQQWLPLILNNKKSGTNDKLLMMMFMQQAQLNNGGASMQSLFPLMLLNAEDDRQCEVTGGTCLCDDNSSNMILYIMMMNGSMMSQNPHNMFLYMMFNKDDCDGKLPDNSGCTCGSDDVQGTDMLTYMMMFMMNPQPLDQNLPAAPPQRSIDIKSVLKQQLFAGLGPEYAWMSQIEDTSTKDLARFQLYQQMGIPPNVMSLIHNNKQDVSTDERFALIQWMSQSQGGSMDIETMSLMLGIEDAKQFYIHGMIEQGQVDPMTASLLLASMGSISKDKLKELLIMAATGQIDPQTFATIAKPYVPELPQGVYPGQDLYFIHLELLDINTCTLIEPSKRKPCGEKQFGAYITAEQCEVHPYCCYNPYFGEDTRLVSNDPANDDSENVPWCYYNIFFVFHDQYKLRVRKADEFKGPQDCPGLFRYGLNLDPYIYYEAVSKLKDATTGFKFGLIDGQQHGFVGGDVQKMAKLIHYRNDVGFPGITEFHCRSILGACWDANAGAYPAQYKIPQCYTELRIYGANDEGQLNLYDPELFKPKVPEKFKSTPGECDTNYFHISTLYYERRACTYTVDMIKYGTEFSPLNEPTREDCLFRLGCCYEDNPQVAGEYSFMPRCYHRTRDPATEAKESKLFEYKVVMDAFNENGLVTNAKRGNAVCGSTHIGEFMTNLVENIFPGLTALEKTTKFNTVFTNLKKISVDADALPDAAWDGYCLYAKSNAYGQIYDLSTQIFDATDAVNKGIWAVFDIFNKKKLVNEISEDNIPEDLKSLKADLF